MKNQTNTNTTGALALALLFAIALQPSTLHAQGTEFTYQGRLNDGANPANGTYDLTFAVFNASNGVSQVGGTLTNLGTAVSNGLFNATLDFGPGVFTGADRWLEIAVRTNGGGSFVTLTPRQQFTPTPYAIFANTASNLSGVIANSSLPVNPSVSGTVSAGGFSGNGANLTSISAGNITTGTLADGELSANVALLNRNGQNFTGSQAFTGGISVNSISGFDQSSAGTFMVDAPFIVGGRLAVLTGGNVGIGTNNPNQKLQVIGNVALTGSLNMPSTATINAGPNRIVFSDLSQNFFAGPGSGTRNTSGSNNSGLGYESLLANTTGIFNTAIGDLALSANTTGPFNTAVGTLALSSETNGTNNTAVGTEALLSLLTGSQNTAVGSDALNLSTNTMNDTAVGFSALSADNAYNNTAVGALSLANNSSGTGNVAVGDQALNANVAGNGNTAVGHAALFFSTGVGENTAIGNTAMESATTGSDNVAIGAGALSTITTGNGNICIGNGTGLQLSTSSSENIVIGNSGAFGDQNTIRIGDVIHHNTYIAGIYGSTAASGVFVSVDSNGHLGTMTSSARFKKNIRSMGDESDVLLSLRPVSFQYKPDYDPQGTPQFGLIAEEVEKVDPDLVAHDDKGGIYTVRYQAVSAMLLNEFLKQHEKIVSQNEDIETLKQQNDTLEKRLEHLEQMMKSGAANN